MKVCELYGAKVACAQNEEFSPDDESKTGSSPDGFPSSEDTSPAPDGSRIEGSAAVVAFWRDWFVRNPDATFESGCVFVSGRRAVARWVLSKYARWPIVAVARRGYFQKVAAKLAYVKG